MTGGTREPDRPDNVEPLVEEVLLRRLRGENVQVEAVLGEHANAHLSAEVRARVDAALSHARSSLEAQRSSAPDLRDFAVLAEVSRDSTGRSYLANQISLGRTVTVKVLPSQVAEDPARLRTFQSLMRKLEGLRHSAIVPVVASGEEDGSLFIATDPVPGAALADVSRSLSEIAPENRSPDDLVEALHRASGLATEIRDRSYTDAVVRIFAELAEGLAPAHAKAVFHRDIRPRNIVLSDGLRPRLRDFGIAQLLETSGLDRSASLVGSASYRSPEIVRHGVSHATAQSDIFSLGLVLFELYTGERLFRAESMTSLLKLHRQPPQAPSRISKNLDYTVLIP